MVLFRVSLRNHPVTWIGCFLIHPLVTALAFVPLTPAGAGIQEFGIVGIFTLLFSVPLSVETAAAYARSFLPWFADL